jgi:NADPH2:quinone reductase
MITTQYMQAWRTHQYGKPLEALHLDTVAIPEPNPGELRVKVQAFPLNLNDLERISGGNMMVEPELPYSPGMEVMGMVDATGEGLEDWIGKRVVATTAGAHGGYAQYAICPPVSAFELPNTVELPVAAAVYFPYHLAWLGLYDRAELQAAETVLITAAAGGSGSAAIQLAKNIGATVIALSGSADKMATCKKLGADHSLNYTEDDWPARVLEITGKRGVDVVFDNVGEAVMEQCMNCIVYNGRYLMMGFASNKVVADEKFIIPRRLAMGNFKLCGVLLAYADPAMSDFLKEAMGWNLSQQSLGQSIHDGVMDLLQNGRINPLIGQVIAFDQVPQAIQAMADRNTVGRSVVIVD